MNGDSSEEEMMMLRDAQDWRSLSLESSAERAAFVVWARESPANVAAFLREWMLSVELNGLDSEKRFDLDKLIATATRQTTESASTSKDSER